MLRDSVIGCITERCKHKLYQGSTPCTEQGLFTKDMKTRKTKETKAFDVKVGANLRAIRMEQGFSVWGLAEATGIREGSLYSYETVRNSITLANSIMLCGVLGITLIDLVK